MTPTPALFDPERHMIRPLRIAAERFYREELLIQRGQLLQLCADLQGMAPDDSVRSDAAKLPHLEASAQLGAIEARLESIDAALSRFRTGQFGLCVECGDPIPAQRLEARPDAESCMPCCQRLRGSS